MHLMHHNHCQITITCNTVTSGCTLIKLPFCLHTTPSHHHCSTARHCNFTSLLNLWKMRLCGNNFCGLLAHTAYCPPSLQTIAEKLSLINTVEFATVFSLKSFPLYGNHYRMGYPYCLQSTRVPSLGIWSCLYPVIITEWNIPIASSLCCLIGLSNATSSRRRKKTPDKELK